MTGRLADRVALITGAASGIGLATARRFAAEGAAVGLVDIDEAAVTTAAEDLRSTGARAVPAIANVAIDDEVRTAVDEVAGRLDGLDVVYNNAGVDSSGSVATATEEDWDRCFDVNVKGTFLVSRAAIPHLSARGGGVIINQASVAGLVGVPRFAAYCAAKGAVVSLTRAMALDLADAGIRVNAIAPGTVFTPLMEPMLRERGGGDLDTGLEMTIRKYPIGRLGRPEDIAATALFLASDDAAFATGSIVTVDGGMTAQ